MKLHEKSCMLDSFCHVLDIPHLQAIAYIGHDGSDHGFHSQEMIDLADHYGYSVTEIQRFPIAMHPKTLKVLEAAGGDERFISHLTSANGVLMGWKGTSNHAVAWVENNFTDHANGLSFPLIRDGKIIEGIFSPMIFLKVRRYD